MAETQSNETIVEIRGLSKAFPGVQALSGVDFTLRRGEVHGLMGENGAGKSTLIKVLTGIHRRDAGQIRYRGQPFELTTPVDAPKHGISTVYQEINLIPALSVAENIYLGRQPRRWGSIDWGAINSRAEAALRRLDVDIDVTQPVSSYSVAIQQLVAIARALDISAQVLILDEPTSSLDTPEVERLFAILRKLKTEGMAILFVTHFIDQVYQISDRITVLRNGACVGEYRTAELPRMDLVAAMLGKQLAAFEQQARPTAAEAARPAPLVQIEGLGRKGMLQPTDLDLYPGEVLGMAGLLGSGRTELARLIFGIDKAQHGQIRVDGQPVAITSPRAAIAHGFGFCPEDRKAEGIIPELTVRENIILALQASHGMFQTLTRKQQAVIVDKYVAALDIRTPSGEQEVQNLSGGNQQKVIVARWLASQPRVLILDEPTRGIDVGAKAEIQRLVMDLSREGMAIVFISSELEEVIRCSDRVAVLRDRRKVTELMGAQIAEHQIMQSIASQEDEEDSL